jgi:DNA-binding response OmpR family regulator
MDDKLNDSDAAKPLKILVADDDTPTRMLLRAAIAQWGYEVVEAADGEQAWQLLQAPDAPWLLIVDWLMPHLDGVGLCQRIKRELKTSPYIILLTQLSGTTNVIKGLEAGADEFLSKPFNMAELRSRLSIGARIVHYERTLKQKQTQIAGFQDQALAMLTKIDSLQVALQGLAASVQNAQQSEAIRAIDIQLADFKRMLTNVPQSQS